MTGKFELMMAPIFVFTDDLDIFKSPSGVGYFESWLVEEGYRAFDAEGRLLKLVVTVVKERSFLWIINWSTESVSVVDTEEFQPEVLHKSLLDYLARLSPANGPLPPSENLADVIDAVIARKGFTA